LQRHSNRQPYVERQRASVALMFSTMNRGAGAQNTDHRKTKKADKRVLVNVCQSFSFAPGRKVRPQEFATGRRGSERQLSQAS
jgi:hypothetical protein